MDDVTPIEHAERFRMVADERRARTIVAAITALALLLVAARVLTFPLQRDEQFYVTAGILFSPGLYEDYGFSHLPNVPLLFATVFAALDTSHYLLAARLVVVVGWVAAAIAAWRIGRDIAHSIAAGGVVLAALLFNPLFLDQTGMTATNNFLPVPLVLWGLWAFTRAVRRGGRPGMALLAGLLLGTAAGMKANYAVVIVPIAPAALLMPAGLAWRQRLTRIAAPMATGAIIGLLPTLIFFLRDPAGFVVHAVAFHRGPQLGYWSQIAREAMPAMSVRAKAVLAVQAWLSGTSLVLIAALVYAVTQARLTSLRDGTVLTVLAMLVLSAAIAFLPTPAFRQYYTLPIPFLLILFALAVGRMPVTARVVAAPVFWAMATAIGLAGLPVTLPALLDVVRPTRWTGVAVHRDALEIAALVKASGPVATLGPLHVLEGGRHVYPQLAMGPFVYRAMDFVPAADLAHYRFFASPRTIDGILHRVPPAAIVTGFDTTLDPAFVAFAVAKGYHAVPLELKRSDDANAAVLYLRPEGAFRPPERIAAER